MKLKSLFALVGTTFGAFCHGGPSKDAPANLMPILDQQPTFEREIKNAKSYWVSSGNNNVSGMSQNS